MVNIPNNPFILVDGSSYLFRAFHALPPLMNKKGVPTGAIFGVVNMLRRLIKEYKPQRIAVVFDSKEKNFRHGLFEAYKANRTVMPDELRQQIEPLHAIIQAMGLPLIMVPGIEADDIIGTLATRAKQQGLFTLISTGDKDFAQLVDDSIILINTMSHDILDRDRIIEKFGLPPEKIVEYLALIGDTVDNIPGVPKVGPKTAVKWLETYGTLDNLIENALEIPGKVGENLREHLGELPLFRQLVTIDNHLSIPYAPLDLHLSVPNKEALETLFSELEFKSWFRDLKELEGSDPVANVPNAEAAETIKGYKSILTETEFYQWFNQFKEAEIFAFGIQATDVPYMQAEVIGFSFSIEPDHAVYIPCAHTYLGAPSQLTVDWIVSHLKPLLEDPTKFKIGHHLKHDAEILLNYGIHLQGIQYDTMLESYVLDSAGSRHDLPTLANKYLAVRMMPLEDIAGKGAKKITFNEISIEDATRYAAEIADVCLNLHTILWSRLNLHPTLKNLFETVEMPLLSVLIQMEHGGVLIDAAELRNQSQELGERLQVLEEEATQMAGQTVNLNSPKQLQEVLFNQLKLPVLEKTPTGQPSTSESVLQELAEQFPLPKIILEYRSLSKLKTTYTDKLPELIDPKTGRIHTSYHQAVTSTGRLSSSDPNLQNIPIRSLEGRKIRAAFIASPGFKIMTADYSQAELRIMAHLSQDTGLIEAFNNNDDIHRTTAAAIFGITVDEVSSEQRRSAKAINFGLMYGMSIFGLSRQLGIDHKEAERHMNRYFACFPYVKIFMEQVRRQALELGYVETLFGRRLYLPDLKSRNAGVRRAAERAAVNAPMQGTNADIIKLAMIELDRWIIDRQLPIKMIMQVHDELVFEVPDPMVEMAKEKIQSVMENVVHLTVKLHIGVGVADNWDAAAH
jgi:DNA polymerase-1